MSFFCLHSVVTVWCFLSLHVSSSCFRHVHLSEDLKSLHFLAGRGARHCRAQYFHYQLSVCVCLNFCRSCFFFQIRFVKNITFPGSTSISRGNFARGHSFQCRAIAPQEVDFQKCVVRKQRVDGKAALKDYHFFFCELIHLRFQEINYSFHHFSVRVNP